MTDLARRLLLPSLITLLVACWLGGGVTVDDTAIDESLQLLALPVLLLAALVLADEGMSGWVRWGIVAAVAVALVPVLQLLPLPEGLWALPTARQALAADLTQAGVQVVPHWSLAPAATERSLWALLPALAAFLASVALSKRQRRTLAQLVVGLVLANVLFAFFQAGLPRDSDLRLYQDFNAEFGGFLANTNHQATACIIAMVLAVGLGAEARRRAKRGETHPHRHWWYFALAGMFLVVVPLATSRAGMVIALPALALALAMTGAVPLRHLRRHPRRVAWLLGLTVLAVLGAHAALGWMAVDQAEEIRHALTAATLDAARAEAPLGSGVGSFVTVFAQAAPLDLQLANYVNHAHNEYAQWWLSTGWAGMAALALVLGVLLAAGWRIAHSEGRSAALAAGAFAALCALLAHSWADYPLRTLALMATAGALAGLMLASLAEAHPRRPGRA